jgi:TrmH family RNA methyltransferase
VRQRRGNRKEQDRRIAAVTEQVRIMASGPAIGNVRIVLCDTSHPGNIGAVARAMKTMGLADLALVRPAAFPHPEAETRASGAVDVLAAACTHASLEAALADVGFAVALSARARDLGPPGTTVREGAAQAVALAATQRVAFVFGGERVGLDGRDASRCHAIARIPSVPGFGSLNVAAAVQVVAYELRLAALGEAELSAPAVDDHDPLADGAAVEQLVAAFQRTMTRTGYLVPERPGRLDRRLRRLFSKARMQQSEVKILRGFLQSVDERVVPAVDAADARPTGVSHADRSGGN